MRTKSLSAMACLACVSLAGAEELEGTLAVVGNRVTVQAQREDRSPAVGAAVRLVREGAAIEEGKINPQGFWVIHVAKAGAYEIWLGDSSDANEALRMPIAIAADAAAVSAERPPCCVGPFLTSLKPTATATAAAREFPIAPAAAGVALLAVTAGLYLRFAADAKKHS